MSKLDELDDLVECRDRQIVKIAEYDEIYNGNNKDKVAAVEEHIARFGISREDAEWMVDCPYGKIRYMYDYGKKRQEGDFIPLQILKVVNSIIDRHSLG